MVAEQKEHLMFYGKKLGVEKDYITDLWYPSIEQLRDILEKDVAPFVDEWDKNEVKLNKSNGTIIFPDSLMRAYKKIVSDPKGFRLYESLLPEEHGGAGLPALAESAFVEQISYYDTSLNVTIGLAITLIEAIGLYPTPHLTEKYFPRLKEGAPGFVAFTEPQAGSNLKNVKTTATEDGDNFIVKGNKIFISNGGYGEIGIVLAKDGEKGTSAFVVDTDMKDADDSSKPGIVATRIEEKLGIHGSPTAVLDFNVVVPKENLLGPRGKGYQTVLERLMGMRMGVSMQACGIAERAYDLANAYAKERVQFGHPIGTFPGVANKLKGMEVNLSRMRKLSFEASYVLSKFQAGQLIKAKYLKTTPEEDQALKEFADQYNRGILNLTISKAKMFNTEVGWMITDDALQIHGGNGFIRDYKVEKLLRDFRILRIYEGTSEIQEYIVNRAKDVGTASSVNALMELAMKRNESGPMMSTLDYADFFYRRFPSVMDAFMDENGEPLYLFDD